MNDSKLRKWLYNIQKNKKQPPYYQLSTIWNGISIEKQLSWIQPAPTQLGKWLYNIQNNKKKPIIGDKD